LPIAEFKIDLINKKIEKVKKIRVLKEKGEIKDLKAVIEEKVALIKYYPGFPSEILDLLIDKQYKGIIIEGTGFGHVNVSDSKLMKAIERAKEENVYVGMTTQTIYGETNPFVYASARKLVKAGVNYLFDMIPETAFVKLSWLLGQGNEGKELRELMLKNFVGEISKEIKVKEFLN
jgi:glutamyl-tRNA(Gln) amidotransferase subunit D